MLLKKKKKKKKKKKAEDIAVVFVMTIGKSKQKRNRAVQFQLESLRVHWTLNNIKKKKKKSAIATWWWLMTGSKYIYLF